MKSFTNILTEIDEILAEMPENIEADVECSIEDEMETIEENVIESNKPEVIREYIESGMLEKRAAEMGVKEGTVELAKSMDAGFKKSGSIYFGLDGVHKSQFGAVATFGKEMEENVSALNASELKVLANNIQAIRWVRFRYGTLIIGLTNK